MFILRAKVKIEDVSSQYVCLGLSGKEAGALLKSSLGTIPQTALAVENNATSSIIRIENERFTIITTPEHAAVLWQQLVHPREARSVHPAGIGSILSQEFRSSCQPIQEQFVLQMLNLDLLDGVSFKKGCYPGQEIVARIRYLGKVKQRTFLAHLVSEFAPLPNDPLYSKDFAGQTSGNILNAAPSPQGGYDVLATLHISSVTDAQLVHWKTPEGAVLGFQTLPYPFPAEKAT
jgi:folate-binding protein YgfZ